MAVPLDKIVDKIAALGVPGIVLLVTMHLVGWTGGAALTTALAALGGPLGMFGGIALLAVLVMISKGLSEYGFERILVASLKRMEKKGKSKQDILQEIDGYRFISSSMKSRISRSIRKA